MAKATEKTTIIAIAVLTTVKRHAGSFIGKQGWDETIADFTREHESEVHAAVIAKLGAAGYVATTGPEHYGFPDIHVRRTADSKPFIRVVRTVPERSYHGGHVGSNSYAVTGKSWGVGSRRYALDCAIDKAPTVWTYTFQMNWQKLLGAVEEELKIVERDYEFEQQKNLVDAMADHLRREMLPHVSRLSLFSDAKKVIVETQNSHATPPLFAVRVVLGGSFTAACALPFLQRFPESVVETKYDALLLKSLTFDQIMAAVADLPVPA